MEPALEPALENVTQNVIQKYYRRHCISCLNKVVIVITLPYPYYEAPCPWCSASVRLWP